MMNPMWSDAFGLWAQTEDHVRVLMNATRRIDDALSTAARPYVAFSGGKDSTAMLHLVLQRRPGVVVWHWDYGPAFVPREYETQIVANAYALGAAQVETDTSAEYARLGRDADNVWGHEFFARVAPSLVARGFDLAFVGLRAEEGCGRRRRIATQDYAGPMNECWPLQDWRWLDVWAYIVSNSLPYLAHYDDVAGLVGYEKSRFSTLFDKQFLHLGTEQVDNVVHWRHRND
ncbi:MAG: phosphoadenosine phosphosulfate reductase family protein [Anaerovoracaceae bacterium]|jgi:3'-phosphoadenosine 5'-phosphosulfate sulfotransferase (PAPS reductase)/FAD synthetase